MPKLKYLKTAASAAKAVDEILIREKPVVSVKCLGCNVGEKGGRITLVAVGCWDGNVYIFDTHKCPAIMYDGGVLRLLQSAELLKVFHNCGPDSVTLGRQFDVKIKHFYDTQIAYSIIMERKGLSPRRLTLAQLCDTYKQQSPSPSPELRRLLGDDMNAWARRPCTQDMLSLVASYVQPLVPALFMQTDRCLPHDSNDWFTTQCDANRSSHLPKMTPRGPRPTISKTFTSGISHCCTCDNCSTTMGEITSTTLYP